ncbi:hypothetical protein OKW32_007579 [Paraburkholderia youngii]
MFLHVTADAGQIGDDFNTHRGQIGTSADAGSQQHAGRSDRSRTQHNFAASGKSAPLACDNHLHTNRPPLFEEHTVHDRVSRDSEIGPI